MDYVFFGNTGMQISRLCLGCMSYGEPNRGPHPWTLPETESRALIRQALEAGINFFDTANMYSAGSSEEILGRALRDFAQRDEILVATKTFMPWRRAPNTIGLSRKAILQSVDDSLVRLGMDYVDLLQIHRFDPHTPLEVTLEALTDVVKAGKVRYIGASTMAAWQFMKALSLSEARGFSCFVSMQNHYNLLYREEEREMLPLCIDQEIATLPWSPLARGRLTRSWSEETERSRSDAYGSTLYMDSDKTVVAAVARIAQHRGLPMAQVALAWLLAKPGVTAPIIGAGKPAHLTDAIAALSIQLTEEEIAELEAPYLPHAAMADPHWDIATKLTLRI